MRQIAYLPKRSGNVSLPAGYKYARSDNGFEGFATQQLLVVRTLVQLFGDIADGLWEGELVTPTRDVAERGEDVALGSSALGACGSALEVARHAGATIFETDDGVQLLDTLHQGV